MTGRPKPTLATLSLDDLVIRGSSHTPFFGVYLATQAIADALCMCHASVGCKVKTQLHLVDHDGVQEAHRRRRYSQFIDEDLINGSTAQLEDEIVAWQARQQSGVVIIDGSTPISLQAQSMKPVIQRMEAATGVPVVHVDARNYEADLWQGYSATQAALIKRLDWAGARERGEVRDDEVALYGYPFDRYEPDHTATVAELRRLLWALGFKAKAVWFAGEPFSAAAEAVHARHHVLLPWARRDVARALKKAGHKPVRTHAPAGVEGTLRWLREVGAALGVDEARVAKVIEHETTRTKALFELARRQLRGRRFAIFAEAPRAAAVLATLRDVGATPVVLGVSHFSLGGAETVAQSLEAHYGHTLDDHVALLEDPTPGALAALGRERDDALQPGAPPVPRPAPGTRADLRHAEVALGSTIERDQVASATLPWVEVGFPSERSHFLYPAPWLGLNGALRTLERVMAALDRGP